MYIKCQSFTYDYQSLFVVCDGRVAFLFSFPNAASFCEFQVSREFGAGIDET